MRSKSRSLLWQKIALHATLTPLALIWLFPLWMMFVFSTMPDFGIFSPDIVLVPSTNFIENFKTFRRIPTSCGRCSYRSPLRSSIRFSRCF